MPTIHEELEKSQTKADFPKVAAKLLKDAGLPAPNPIGKEAKEVLTRVSSQVPAVWWVPVGEKAGSAIESRPVTQGRWTTKVTVHLDRARNVVAEGHTRGVEGDYDHTAWVAFKKHANEAKALDAWAKLLKKYRLATDADPAPPAKAPPPKARTPKGTERPLKEAYWKDPSDRGALRVLADLWLEKGDPRGEFVQLSLLDKPTKEQAAKRESLRESLKGKLVGPAREFVTEWSFGDDGLVEKAGTDAERFVKGREEIEWLNPRLALTISTRKLAAVKALAEGGSLERIHFVTLTTQLNDKKLELLAPALAKTKNLSLGCRGRAEEIISPAGLRTLGDHAKELEYLEIDFYCDTQTLGPYLDVLATHPGFAKLMVVTVNGTDAEVKVLKKLPKLVQLITPRYMTDGVPRTALDLELVKKGKKLDSQT